MPTCYHCHDYLNEGKFCKTKKKDCMKAYLDGKVAKAKAKADRNSAPPKYVKIGKGTLLELPNNYSKKQVKDAVERFKGAQI